MTFPLGGGAQKTKLNSVAPPEYYLYNPLMHLDPVFYGNMLSGECAI